MGNNCQNCISNDNEKEINLKKNENSNINQSSIIVNNFDLKAFENKNTMKKSLNKIKSKEYEDENLIFVIKNDEISTNMVIDKNNNIYYGNINNDMKGKGIKKLKNKEKYEGEFNNLLFNGYGSYKYKNGNIYRGWWKNNKKNGKGILITKKEKIIGIWKDDVLQK